MPYELSMKSFKSRGAGPLMPLLFWIPGVCNLAGGLWMLLPPGTVWCLRDIAGFAFTDAHNGQYCAERTLGSRKRSA
jgi:hypothetical protein